MIYIATARTANEQLLLSNFNFCILSTKESEEKGIIEFKRKL
jgi:hypothetical protein